MKTFIATKLGNSDKKDKFLEKFQVVKIKKLKTDINIR